VVLSNVHFPTDINLLWDCARKTLDTIASILADSSITGFRQHKGIRKKLRNGYRQTSEIHRKKGSNYASRLKDASRLKGSCTNYLYLAEGLVNKLEAAQADLMAYAVHSHVMILHLVLQLILMIRVIVMQMRMLI